MEKIQDKEEIFETRIIAALDKLNADLVFRNGKCTFIYNESGDCIQLGERKLEVEYGKLAETIDYILNYTEPYCPGSVFMMDSIAHMLIYNAQEQMFLLLNLETGIALDGSITLGEKEGRPTVSTYDVNMIWGIKPDFHIKNK